MNSSLISSFIDDETAQRCTKALRAIPWHDPRLTSRRSNVSGNSEKVQSFVLGRNPTSGEEPWYMSHPDFTFVLKTAFTELSRAMRKHDPSFIFHQVTLNYNVQCKKHRDKGNEGPSYITGFGCYEGSELVVWNNEADAPQIHNVHNRFVQFNGKTQWHETSSFQGRMVVNGNGTYRAKPERITAVFYSAGPGGKWQPKAAANASSDKKGAIHKRIKRSEEVTPGQKLAISSALYTPCSIIAGAGCGKTFTLVRRIARLVLGNASGCDRSTRGDDNDSSNSGGVGGGDDGYNSASSSSTTTTTTTTSAASSPSSSRRGPRFAVVDPRSVVVLTFSRKACAEIKGRLDVLGLAGGGEGVIIHGSRGNKDGNGGDIVKIEEGAAAMATKKRRRRRQPGDGGNDDGGADGDGLKRNAGGGGVQCFTFHAFALRLLREFGTPRERRAVTLSEAKQMKIVHACLDQWFAVNESKSNGVGGDGYGRGSSDNSVGGNADGVNISGAADGRKNAKNPSSSAEEDRTTVEPESMGNNKKDARESEEAAEEKEQERRQKRREKEERVRVARRVKGVIDKAKTRKLSPSSLADECTQFVFNAYTHALQCGGAGGAVIGAVGSVGSVGGHCDLRNGPTSGHCNTHGSTAAVSADDFSPGGGLDAGNARHRDCGDDTCGFNFGSDGGADDERNSSPVVLDFADLLPMALEVLKRPRALAAARQRYAFGFVDEFQDTSLAQFQLLTMLFGEDGGKCSSSSSSCDGGDSTIGGSRRSSLTVVGDDDQMIYGWRDAMPNAFAHFAAAFPHHNTIRLEVSFRTKNARLLDAATAVVIPIASRAPRAKIRPHVPSADTDTVSFGRGTAAEATATGDAAALGIVQKKPKEMATTKNATAVRKQSGHDNKETSVHPIIDPTEVHISLSQQKKNVSSPPLPCPPRPPPNDTGISDDSLVGSGGVPVSSSLGTWRPYLSSNYSTKRATKSSSISTSSAAYSLDPDNSFKPVSSSLPSSSFSRPKFRGFVPPVPVSSRQHHKTSHSTAGSVSAGCAAIGLHVRTGNSGHKRGREMTNASSFHHDKEGRIRVESETRQLSPCPREPHHPTSSASSSSTFSTASPPSLLLKKEEKEGRLRFLITPSQQFETDFIAARIRNLLEPSPIKTRGDSSGGNSHNNHQHSDQMHHHVRWGNQVVVLSRSGACLTALAKRMSEFGVPCTILGDGSDGRSANGKGAGGLAQSGGVDNDSHSGGNTGSGGEGLSMKRFTQRKAVMDAVAFLRLVANESDDASFVRCLRATRGLGAKFETDLIAHAAALSTTITTTTTTTSGDDNCAEQRLGAPLSTIISSSNNTNHSSPLDLLPLTNQQTVETNALTFMGAEGRTATSPPRPRTTTETTVMPLLCAARRALAATTHGVNRSGGGQKQSPSTRNTKDTKDAAKNRRPVKADGANTDGLRMELKKGQVEGLRKLFDILDLLWDLLCNPQVDKDTESVRNYVGCDHGGGGDDDGKVGSDDRVDGDDSYFPTSPLGCVVDAIAQYLEPPPTLSLEASDEVSISSHVVEIKESATSKTKSRSISEAKRAATVSQKTLSFAGTSVGSSLTSDEEVNNTGFRKASSFCTALAPAKTLASEGDGSNSNGVMPPSIKSTNDTATDTASLSADNSNSRSRLVDENDNAVLWTTLRELVDGFVADELDDRLLEEEAEEKRVSSSAMGEGSGGDEKEGSGGNDGGMDGGRLLLHKLRFFRTHSRYVSVLGRFLDALADDGEVELSMSLEGTSFARTNAQKEGGRYSTARVVGEGGKVTLSTIHKAKGLEWDHVFVIRAHDGGGGLPSLFRDDTLGETLLEADSLYRDEETVLDEERRLLHVAITRARLSCTITCSAVDAFGQHSSPTRFLNDIPSNCVDISSLAENEVRSECAQAKSFHSDWQKQEALLAASSDEADCKLGIVPANISSTSREAFDQHSQKQSSSPHAAKSLNADAPPLFTKSSLKSADFAAPPRHRALCPHHHISLRLEGGESDYMASKNNFLLCCNISGCLFRINAIDWLEHSKPSTQAAHKPAASTPTAEITPLALSGGSETAAEKTTAVDVYGNSSYKDAKRPNAAAKRTISSFFKPSVSSAILVISRVDNMSESLHATTVASATSNVSAVITKGAPLPTPPLSSCSVPKSFDNSCSKGTKPDRSNLQCVHGNGPECMTCAQRLGPHEQVTRLVKKEELKLCVPLTLVPAAAFKVSTVKRARDSDFNLHPGSKSGNSRSSSSDDTNLIVTSNAKEYQKGLGGYSHEKQLADAKKLPVLHQKVKKPSATSNSPSTRKTHEVYRSRAGAKISPLLQLFWRRVDSEVLTASTKAASKSPSPPRHRGAGKKVSLIKGQQKLTASSFLKFQPRKDATEEVGKQCQAAFGQGISAGRTSTVKSAKVEEQKRRGEGATATIALVPRSPLKSSHPKRPAAASEMCRMGQRVSSSTQRATSLTRRQPFTLIPANPEKCWVRKGDEKGCSAKTCQSSGFAGSDRVSPIKKEYRSKQAGPLQPLTSISQTSLFSVDFLDD